MLGSGFREESLFSAVAGATFIGCDAGSTDLGPYYLGSGMPHASREATSRDLELILAAARQEQIPVVIGSAGTAGGTPHVSWTLEIVREIAQRHGWHFTIGIINTELAVDELVAAYRRLRLRPLSPTVEIDEHVFARATRVVAMIGVEPLQAALAKGADVVVAGRTSDAAIYAAVPLALGIPPAVAWHAGKVIECGAACADQRHEPDSVVAELDATGFTVSTPNPAIRCTPASVVSHSLYENANPDLLTEPSGVLDIGDCRYDAIDERSVRVTGSRFTPALGWTVRLEGAELAGYRAMSLASIRDPLVLARLPVFVDEVQVVVRDKIRRSVGLGDDAYRLTWRVYGRNAAARGLADLDAVASHEVGLVVDAVASTQADADAVIAIAWHTALHHPSPEYVGLVSNLAFPMSPPSIPCGAVYRFCLNHVLMVDDPVALFPITLERV
jgi:hypothetical protein